MTRGRQVVLTVAAVALGIALAAVVLRARQSAYPDRQTPERLLYLRSGKVADRLVLSFDALAADVYWIRTIQHYGRDRKSARTADRFSLLYPLLDLTTTLDPHFNIAYRFGWLFLAMLPPDGPGRPDLAIALLEKGMRANPGRWQYAYDAGFVHYWYTGDYREAAGWFSRAASMPAAPEWLGPLAAATKIQGGDRREARRMLESLRQSEDGYVRVAAERGLAQLQALDAIDALQAVADQFHARAGRYPADMIELARAAGLPAGMLPADAAGRPFLYDAPTHTVLLAPDSPLGPLPRTMSRR